MAFARLPRCSGPSPGSNASYDRNYSFVGTRGVLRNGDYNSRLLLTVDGHRLNDAIFGGVLLGPEFPIDLNDIDRVEVIRGPGSSLYGSSALLGVINVITKRSDTNGVEVSTIAGGRASVGASIGPATVYTSITAQHSGGAPDLYFPEFAADSGYASGLDGSKRVNALVNMSIGHFQAQDRKSVV